MPARSVYHDRAACRPKIDGMLESGPRSDAIAAAAASSSVAA